MNAVNGIVVFGFIWILSLGNDESVIRASDDGKTAAKFVSIELA